MGLPASYFVAFPSRNGYTIDIWRDSGGNS